MLENYEENIKFLKSLVIQTRHLKNNMLIRVDRITKFGSNRMFAYRGLLGITVPQYYFVKHGIYLSFRGLPCIVQRGGGMHVSYFPIEVLEVLDLDCLSIN